ncbi:hypothetical protein E2562_016244 [Oryza meyeriana var. granulata]|uniref:Uncharacterized protein n=1 Tax=Oryza meyeriana var. granulata TaxID=110450 RepID=A0A6G1CPK4_9ORYZ|nr:hypothetical protein E2562_016244 [Oryza meyeriana var. granulata]
MDYGRWVARFSSSFPHLALFFFPSCSSAISHRPAGRKGRKEQGRAAKMIYRNWSLLSSTFVIWGGVATAGLAGIFLFGGKEKFQNYLSREGERLRQQDRAGLGKN